MSVSPNNQHGCQNPLCTNIPGTDGHVLFGGDATAECKSCSQTFCSDCMVIDHVMCRYCSRRADAIRDQPSDDDLSYSDQPENPFADYYFSEDYIVRPDPNDPSPSIEEAE
jgi:hypothetical protein